VYKTVGNRGVTNSPPLIKSDKEDMLQMKKLMEENESLIIHDLYSQHFGKDVHQKRAQDIENKLENKKKIENTYEA
jgi:hypothetical protein